MYKLLIDIFALDLDHVLTDQCHDRALILEMVTVWTSITITIKQESDMEFQLLYLDLTLALSKSQGPGNRRLKRDWTLYIGKVTRFSKNCSYIIKMGL